MTRVVRRSGHAPWIVALGAMSLAGWAVLLVDGGGLMPSALCSSEVIWGSSPPASLELLLWLNAPAKAVCGAALMIAAMMLPLVAAPLQHVHDRSFASLRGRAMLFFLAGYGMVWMCAATGLEAVALTARWAAPTLLASGGLAAAAALLWQASPAKQWCLNRCHRRPELAAFGAAALRDAFVFGMTNGVYCAGACWALMLLAISTVNLHLVGMAVVALFVFGERFERPAPLGWQWRWPCKAVRIAATQLRMHLAARSYIRT